MERPGHSRRRHGIRRLSFTIRVTDAASETADVELTLHVESSGPPALAITPPGTPLTTIGTSAASS
jgi:hypothetical protein